jgi:tRNA threonylcarbamoyladenosine biosynthesis protein TsaE
VKENLQVERSEILLPDEQATNVAGRVVANPFKSCGGVIELCGDLGAGKTTLARAFLRELGVHGAIKSPTYALIEPYNLGDRRVLHLDLYRIADPEELEFLGIRDVDTTQDILLIEWPQRGGDRLPKADLRISLSYHGPGRMLKICGTAAWQIRQELRQQLGS